MTNKNIKTQKIVISAERFLDLLCSVIPAAAQDDSRKNISSVKFELNSEDYSLSAIATNGKILSFAKRDLGFSTAQEDLEDLGSRQQLSDTEWLMSIFDAELLVVALKKLGIKRSNDNKAENPSYICLEEHFDDVKQILKISILGQSNVILEPQLMIAEFPDYKKLVPKNESQGLVQNFGFNLLFMQEIIKCWGLKQVSLRFYDNGSLSKLVPLSTEYDGYDFILLMPVLKDQKREEEIDIMQQWLFN